MRGMSKTSFKYLSESVGSRVTRFHQLRRRYESAAKRAPRTHNPWAVFVVRIWANGLEPEVRHTRTPKKPPITLQESVDRARNTKAGNVTNHTASPVAFSHIPPSQLRHSRKGGKKREASAPQSVSRPRTYFYRHCSRPTPRLVELGAAVALAQRRGSGHRDFEWRMGRATCTAKIFAGCHQCSQ